MISFTRGPIVGQGLFFVIAATFQFDKVTGQMSTKAELRLCIDHGGHVCVRMLV